MTATMAGGTVPMEESVREVILKLQDNDDALNVLAAQHVRLLCTKGEDVRRRYTPAARGTKDYFRSNRKMFDAEMAAALTAGGAASALISLLQTRYAAVMGQQEAAAEAEAAQAQEGSDDAADTATSPGVRRLANRDHWIVIEAAVSALSVLCLDIACAALVLQEASLKLLVQLITGINEQTMETAVSSMMCLLGLASSHDHRIAIVQAGVMPALVKALDFGPEQVVTEVAVEAIANLAFADENKAVVRECGGLYLLVRLLNAGAEHPVVELAIQALTILSFQSPENQVEIRERDAIGKIISVIGLHASPKVAGTVMASVELLRVLAQNEANRAVIREEGAFPQLVALLQNCTINKALDPVKTLEALGVLCANNDLNKSAFRDANGVLVLMDLLPGYGPIAERATRLIVTLSLSPSFHVTIRDAGGIQRLTGLLQQKVKTYHITALAAKALANLAVTESTRTTIRLAGAVPALVWLLTDMPTKEVFNAVEDALRRMEVTDLERNAILQTLRYVENQQAAKDALEKEEDDKKAAEEEEKKKKAAQKPLVRYSVEDLMSLLEAMGLQDVPKLRNWGLTGGDLLWLDDSVLVANEEAMPLHPLERLKIRKVQEANFAFSACTKEPGSGVATVTEVESYLGSKGIVDPELSSIVTSLMQASDSPTHITFRDFCLMFDWLKWTLDRMGVRISDV